MEKASISFLGLLESDQELNTNQFFKNFLDYLKVRKEAILFAEYCQKTYSFKKESILFLRNHIYSKMLPFMTSGFEKTIFKNKTNTKIAGFFKTLDLELFDSKSIQARKENDLYQNFILDLINDFIQKTLDKNKPLNKKIYILKYIDTLQKNNKEISESLIQDNYIDTFNHDRLVPAERSYIKAIKDDYQEDNHIDLLLINLFEDSMIKMMSFCLREDIQDLFKFVLIDKTFIDDTIKANYIFRKIKIFLLFYYKERNCKNLSIMFGKSERTIERLIKSLKRIIQSYINN